MLESSTLYGGNIFGDHGKAEIRNARMTRVIHQDIYLVRCEYEHAIRFRATAYPLEIPVYHVARMEVAKTRSNVSQLVTRVSLRRTR